MTIKLTCCPECSSLLIADNGALTCELKHEYVQAKCMQEAVEAAQNIYIKDNYDWLKDEDYTPHDHYQGTVLLGCSLIGELANPAEDRQT